MNPLSRKSRKRVKEPTDKEQKQQNQQIQQNQLDQQNQLNKIFTPPGKILPAFGIERSSHSPNSNSISLIYDRYFPRTPVKKIQESKGKQKSMDQLEQLMEKGILNIALVKQVSFNSTQDFMWLKNNLYWDISKSIPCRFQSFEPEHLQHLINNLKRNLSICQVYERNIETEPSMLNPKGDTNHSKQSYITTLLDVYANYRRMRSKDHFFTLANPTYIILFGYKEYKPEIQEEMVDQKTPTSLVPFGLYITRNAATSNSFTLRNNPQAPSFLQQNHIKSTCISIDPLLNALIPSVVSLQFPTKYSVNLVQGKYLHHLLNTIVATDKEQIDVAASFPFHGSSSHVTQIYNGIDYLVTDVKEEFFNTEVGHQEFKIQFDGILTIQQVCDLKQSFKDLGYLDVVVSETKLNPITTLLTQSTYDKIDKILSKVS